MNAVRTFSNHFTVEDFLKLFLIPIHIPGHWMLCILDPLNKTYYIVDSRRNNNVAVTENIRKWYKIEMERLNYDVSHESDYDIYLWRLINLIDIPSHVPKQSDSSSCSIFVLTTAFYWYHYQRLPNSTHDCNYTDVNSTNSNLRHFVIFFLLHTKYTENNRMLIIT
jgi:Ulp1 family protease